MSRKYSEIYQRTHDVDWFCKYAGRAYHFASNGGAIPSGIKSKSNGAVQDAVAKLNQTPETVDSVYISRGVINLIENRIDDLHAQPFSDRVNDYLETFVEMASKGFISIDNHNSRLFEDPDYHIVAYPKFQGEIGTPNDEIFEQLPDYDVSEIIDRIDDFYSPDDILLED